MTIHFKWGKIFAVEVGTSLGITPKDELELKIFDAIEALIIYQILVDAEQMTLEHLKFSKKRELKVIYQSYQNLLKKFQHQLSSETIQQMVDDLLSWSEFLPELKSEYLTGTPEDKEKIVQQLDFEKLNKETFALITSHLERKGCLKRSKGFGNL